MPSTPVAGGPTMNILVTGGGTVAPIDDAAVETVKTEFRNVFASVGTETVGSKPGSSPPGSIASSPFMRWR